MVNADYNNNKRFAKTVRKQFVIGLLSKLFFVYYEIHVYQRSVRSAGNTGANQK